MGAFYLPPRRANLRPGCPALRTGTWASVMGIPGLRKMPTEAYFRQMFADDPGFCGRCGYKLTGNVSGVCPECGWRLPDKTAGRSPRL